MTSAGQEHPADYLPSADGNIGDQPAKADLSRRAARGAAASLTGQLLKALVQIVSVAVLARLLSVDDYGVLALLLAVMGIGEVFRDFGLSTAAVSAAQLSETQRSNLFWMNLAIGGFLSLLMVAVSPVIAQIFNMPQAAPVGQAMAGVFLLNGAAAQYRASLERALKFRRLAMIDATSAAIGATCAISFALIHPSVWALALQQLTTVGSMLVLVAVSARWMPRAARRGHDTRRFVGVGAGLVGSQLVGYVANNVDSFIVGYRFGAGQLGLYNRAFQLLMQPFNQVRVPLTRVALPVLARLHDAPDRYRNFVLHGQLAIGYSVTLIMAIAVGAAAPVVDVFLGTKWSAAAPLLACFAVAAAFQSIDHVSYWIFVTRGLTTALFQLSMITATIRIIAIAVGATWGVLGVAIGYAVAPAAIWPLSFWFLSRRTEIPARDLFAGALRIIAVAAVASIASFAGSQAGSSVPILSLGCAVLAGGIGVALVISCVPRLRSDVASLRAMVRLLRN